MKKTASIISLIGNPLIMIPLSMEVLLFKYGNSENFLTISLITGMLFVTAISWITYKHKKGDYSDYNISDRKQRYSLYHFAIPLIFVTAFLFSFFNQPKYLSIAFSFGGLLMIISYLSNFVIKSSLHTSLNIYLAFSVFIIHDVLGVLIFCFTLMIACSRVILKKHTISEVISGFLIGEFSGLCLYFFTVN